MSGRYKGVCVVGGMQSVYEVVWSYGSLYPLSYWQRGVPQRTRATAEIAPIKVCLPLLLVF
jgi:hypothetical protein